MPLQFSFIPDLPSQNHLSLVYHQVVILYPFMPSTSILLFFPLKTYPIFPNCPCLQPHTLFSLGLWTRGHVRPLHA
uniref:Uncharacterized protein n=1 Tax=Arundo donax TaxID=35708 RepID=A0A0A9BQ45_ARUDO